MIATIIQYHQLIIHGIVLTITFTICSLAIGFVLAVLLSSLRHCGPNWLNRMLGAYVGVVRGTPVLLQIFFLYYGPTQFPDFMHSWMGVVFNNPYLCLLIVLANNTMCYTSVLLLEALQSQPKKQIDVANNLRLSKLQILLSIKLSYAIRKIIPAYQNEVITMFKSTSLASTIAILDITGVAKELASLTYEMLPWYGMCALIYLLIGVGVSSIYRKIAQRIVLVS